MHRNGSCSALRLDVILHGVTNDNAAADDDDVDDAAAAAAATATAFDIEPSDDTGGINIDTLLVSIFVPLNILLI